MRRVGGAAEMVRSAGAGLLFDDWDAKSVSAALTAALKMSEDDRLYLVEMGRSWMTRSLELRDYKSALKGILF